MKIVFLKETRVNKLFNNKMNHEKRRSDVQVMHKTNWAVYGLA